ncbi:hypothetical protein [Methylorubrum populi]|uniref:hypothetical protein n=1 Tax=Methylorubrum populi TaxID=223967 RepID=UPI000DB7DA17|nr:hypothetical protein [Methylorubrum populi]PZP71787.1 MAG: hypothetical protein DI590_05870 [Methylorubrum populi]
MRSILALLLLTSAASAAPVSRQDKAVILDWARSFMVDPYSLRSTGISDPQVISTGARVVCVEYNAKNQVGGYTGIDRKAFVYTPSGFVPSYRGTGGVTNLTCWGPEFVMRPFPELSSIR